MTFLRGILSTVAVSAFVLSCTVQKRHYREGIYIHFRDKSQGLAKKEMTHQHEFLQEKKSLAQSKSGASPVTVHDLTGNPPDSCADEITFRDGSMQRVRILEIGEGVVKYRRCDNMDGPLISKGIEKVFSVHYANGARRVFTPSRTVSPAADKQIKASTNGMAVASFVSGLLSVLIVPSILAFIFGLVSLKQFENNPGLYKGKWMAIVGLILGSIVLALFLLLLGFNF